MLFLNSFERLLIFESKRMFIFLLSFFSYLVRSNFVSFASTKISISLFSVKVAFAPLPKRRIVDGKVSFWMYSISPDSLILKKSQFFL